MTVRGRALVIAIALMATSTVTGAGPSAAASLVEVSGTIRDQVGVILGEVELSARSPGTRRVVGAATCST